VLAYTGSLNHRSQEYVPLLRAIATLNSQLSRQGQSVILRIAGSPAVIGAFDGALGTRPSWIEWLGWLEPAELRRMQLDSDCLVLLNWATPDRVVVPSKLFDYLALNKPILLAGRDSGGVENVLREWGHPPVIAQTEVEIAAAIRLCMSGDDSGMMQRASCARQPLGERQMCNRYLQWARTLSNKPQSC
jgi:hypothetical protein